MLGWESRALDQEDVKLEGQIREKLVRTKERWAEEGRLLTGTTADPTRERLPPGQTLVKDWPVLDLGVQPDVSTAKFRLRLEGLVENRLAFDWEGFMALPQAEMVCDIHCVTQWSRYDNRFTGVSTATLLEMARPRPEARFVSMTSYDGYTTNLTLEAFAAADVMVAHSWEGAPLTRQHGGPARLVLPRLYFWKSPKWLTRIEFLAEDRPGFWEVRGYHNQGDPWLEERYG
ncbi:MAG: sulfite oxidase-like oxidoreductase [Roseomonas sp.]|jgi:DMSO/TMAO reductase YedYZ molybdopterin-dependent catalytic subunit|nr:sulfite oxidase-like oxidoreductase [Roseomonas sp.]